MSKMALATSWSSSVGVAPFSCQCSLVQGMTKTMTYYDSEDTSSNIMSQPLHHQEYVHIWPLVLHELLASVQHVAGSAAIQEAKTAAWQKLFSGYDGFNPY